MTYQKVEEVEAIQLKNPVFDNCGNKIADKGDWLIIENEKQYYMSDKEFNKEFMKKEEPITFTFPPIEIKPLPPLPDTSCCKCECWNCCNWYCCSRKWDQPYKPKPYWECTPVIPYWEQPIWTCNDNGFGIVE